MEDKNYNLAFVFPGQGSQSVGMLADLAKVFPLVKETFAQASAAIDLDLWDLVQNGPEEELSATRRTQPAMLAAGVAVWRVWCQQTGVRPAWMAGHSLGEYTALVCSETITFEEGVRLVAARGELMQKAVPGDQGAMAAIIGLEDHQVVHVCQEQAGDDVVAAVNFNAPGQVVIAGHKDAVERAMQAAKAAGAKRAVKLPVSVPSHCSLMASAADEFAGYLNDINIQIPDVNLIHNVDVAAHSAAKVIRNALREQLYKPVRWVDSIKFMFDQGVNIFVECGPGRVLTGLNKRIAPTAAQMSIYDVDSLYSVLEQIDG